MINYYLSVLKKYAVFSGRSQRAEYWYFILFNIIISAVLNTAGLFISSFFNSLSVLYSLVIFIPSLAASVRRLHDVGLSGWMLLIGLIPLIGWIALIILLAKEGDPNDNKYGPAPKEEIAQNVS